jgi:lipid-binding SYLF domain-containing protein
MKRKTVRYLVVSMVAVGSLLFTIPVVKAETAAEIDREVDLAIEKMREHAPAAKELSKVAKGILVFPKVTKAGLFIGGQYGVGALREGGETVGYYKTTAASYGLQAGAQTFGYSLIFMNEKALEYLKESSGWELGVGPSIVVADEGMASSLTSTTAKDDIYAFFFSQTGLMAGLGVQGSKITQFTPDK